MGAAPAQSAAGRQAGVPDASPTPPWNGQGAVRRPMRKNAHVYLRIADAIRHDIVSRGLPAHTRLPSEPELARTYRAARATVRRALATLQAEGLIYARQAVGTFVAEARVEQDLDQLFSFSEFMVYRGIKPGSRVITAERQRITDPHAPVLHYLGLRPGAEVIFVRRLRLGGDQPLVIANTWLPAARFPAFLEQDLAHRSIYDLMEATGSRPTDAVQTIEAITLPPEEAALLTVPPGSAALLVRRVGYARGVPVEYAVDHYRADRTTFRVRLGVLEKRLAERIHHDHIAF
ncbi:MAG TPA: GntR family transcriptional regulator [Vicinamibacterales bacterium]